MRCTAPIIVNGFGRGGTNILMNLLLSSPELVCPSGELNKVFKGKGMGDSWATVVRKRLMYDIPIQVLSRQNLFDRFLFESREIPSKKEQAYIDWVLQREIVRATHEAHNKWKTRDVLYTKEELKEGRMVVKAHNGLVFLDDVFRDMYSDVRFVAIVRSGFAVCEGYMRRGWSRERATEMYTKVGKEIARQSKDKNTYLLVQFEDVLARPLDILEEVYQFLTIPFDSEMLIRLQQKATIQSDATHKLKGDYDRQVVWYSQEAMASHFDPSVNKNQLKRLSDADRTYIREACAETHRSLGYSDIS